MAMGFLHINASASGSTTALPTGTTSPSTPSTPTTPRLPQSMRSAGNATPKTRELAPFLRLLREMLNSEPPTVIRWTPDGRAFEILDLHQMTHVILPKYFKHRKYASFQRQLNYFHFRKWTKSRSPLCTFANPFFIRDAPELTWHIVRKRDLTHKTKRPRAQSDDDERRTSSAADSMVAAEAKATLRSSRSRAESASASASAAQSALVSAAPSAVAASDPQGLLQWIDAQFPSIASIELLNEAGVDSSESSFV